MRKEAEEIRSCQNSCQRITPFLSVIVGFRSLAIDRRHRDRRAKKMEGRLILEPGDQVFDPCHLFKRAVEKDCIAILVSHIAYNAIDPVYIRMKIIKAQLVPTDKIDHDTNADADRQSKNMDQRIPLLPQDIAPGYLHRNGIHRHREAFVQTYPSILCQMYNYVDIHRNTYSAAAPARPVTIQPLSG